MNTIISSAFVRNCVYLLLVLAVCFLIPCSQLMPGSENGKGASQPTAQKAGGVANITPLSGTEIGNPVDSCKVAINDDSIMDFMKLLP